MRLAAAYGLPPDMPAGELGRALRSLAARDATLVPRARASLLELGAEYRTRLEGSLSTLRGLAALRREHPQAYRVVSHTLSQRAASASPDEWGGPTAGNGCCPAPGGDGTAAGRTKCAMTSRNDAVERYKRLWLRRSAELGVSV